MASAPFLSFWLFCLALTGTPGPNTILVAAAALRGGARHATPVIAGVACGAGLQFVLIGQGLGGALAAVPALQPALKLLGVLFLLWLALRLALGGPMDLSSASERPLGFWSAAAFQWINPKSWAGLSSAAAVYLPPAADGLTVAALAAILMATAVATLSVWALLGSLLHAVAAAPAWRRRVNALAAALLLLAILPIALS